MSSPGKINIEEVKEQKLSHLTKP